MRPKNRVWGSSRSDRSLPLENGLRCPEPRRKSRPTPTIFTPGIPQWPSRDPIGERGGVNLYGFVGNDGVNDSDYLGREGNIQPNPDLSDEGYAKLKDEALKKLRNLCENKKCLGDCGCTKERCLNESNQIADKMIEAFKAMANHPEGWGARPGNKNNDANIHQGWMCFHWQAIMANAMQSLKLECFKVGSGSKTATRIEDGKLKTDFEHSWVNLVLWSKLYNVAMKEGFHVERAPNECILRLDPWRDYSPKLFTPEEHGFKETFVSDAVKGPITIGWNIGADMTIPGDVDHTNRWLPILPQPPQLQK